MQSMVPGNAGFDIVLRGYDRRQVDERLRFLGAELAAAEQALGAAQERTAVVEDELAAARAELGRAESTERSPRYGERMEKILQLAEDEATEVRERAAAQSAEVVQQARTEAEQIVATANVTARRREQDAQRELDRLGRLRDEVQERLRNARALLDDHLPQLQDAELTDAPVRAGDGATGKMGAASTKEMNG